MTTPVSSSPDLSLNQTDYLTLFMQELSYQDPLKPVDNREFMAQMAQFSSLQETKATNEALQLILGMMSGNQSLLLLGKHVKIKASDEEGRVTKIEFPDNAAPVLNIAMNKGELKEVKLTDISTVWE